MPPNEYTHPMANEQSRHSVFTLTRFLAGADGLQNCNYSSIINYYCSLLQYKSAVLVQVAVLLPIEQSETVRLSLVPQNVPISAG